MYVDPLPSLKVLASCAASLASLFASSFPAMELFLGAQLISTVLPALCRILIPDVSGDGPVAAVLLVQSEDTNGG